MIDTVKGYLNLSGLQVPIPVSDLFPKLENPKILQNPSKSTGYLKGFINNFKISIRYSLSEEIAVQVNFEGSIPKFLHGNNIAHCKPTDIQLVIESLSDTLGITLDDAKITRIDFGCNFLVKHPVSYYIKAIQEFPRKQRVLYQGQTVAFRTKSNASGIIFYDKIKEMKKDMNSRQSFRSLPDFIKQLNILRYEVKLLKNVNCPILATLKFIDLCSTDTFQNFYDYLVATLRRINIIDFEVPSDSFVLGQGWLKNFLAYIGLQKYGINEAFDLIDNHDYKAQHTSVARSQHRKSIRELVSKKGEILHTSIKRELESKLGALYGIFL